MSTTLQANDAVRLKDVADRANVSVGTASRGLDPLKSRLVAEQTRERIQRAAEELGFVPNRAARSFRRSRTGTLVFLSPDISHEICFGQFSVGSMMIPEELVKGCLLEAERFGYTIQLRHVSDDLGDDAHQVDTLGPRHCDGVIFLGLICMERLRDAVCEREIPAVLLNTQEVPPTVIPAVTADTYAGAFEAAQSLIGRGWRRIAYLYPRYDFSDGSFRHPYYVAPADMGPGAPAPSPNDQISRRYLGYRDALLNANAFDRELVIGFRNTLEIDQTLDRIPELPFDAALCANDELAAQFIESASQRGIEVPRDLAVIGYDNHPFRLYDGRRLSTVDVPRIELGRKATRTLVEGIESGTEPDPGKLLPTRFLRRETG